MTHFLLSGFGCDRPGMVATVSKVLLDLGANLEDTSMTRLGGQFAMLMVLSDGEQPLSEASIKQAIASRRQELNQAGIHLIVAEIEEDAHLEVAEDTRYLVRVSGADRPGIVHEVTQWLAGRNVNIVDLSSRRLIGRNQAIYLLLLEVVLPADYTAATMQDESRQLQTDLGLEVQVEAIDVMML